jgi:hypothetical protein
MSEHGLRKAAGLPQRSATWQTLGYGEGSR